MAKLIVQIFFNNIQCAHKFLRSISVLTNYVSVAQRKFCDHKNELTINSCRDVRLPIKNIEIFLENILNLSTNQIINVIKNNKWIKVRDCETIMSNYNVVKDIGLSDNQILNHFWVLNEDLDDLLLKLQAFKNNNINMDVAINYIHLPTKYCIFIANYMNFNTEKTISAKIKFVAERLQTNEIRVCQLFLTHNYLEGISIAKMEAVLDLLTEFNVKKSYILNDPVVFQYNILSLYKKLDSLKKAGIKDIKPWMIRLSDDGLKRLFERRNYLTNNFSSNNLAVYLCEKLNADIEAVLLMMTRIPRFEKTSIKIVDKKINLLHDYGYTNEDIITEPRILRSSHKLIEKRLNLMKEAKNDSPKLNLLLFKSHFEKHLQMKMSK